MSTKLNNPGFILKYGLWEIDKTVDAVLDYGFKWSTWLGTDTIATSVWAIDPSGELIVDSDQIANLNATAVWISGGILNKSYMVTNTVTTTGGRTASRSFKVNIVATQST